MTCLPLDPVDYWVPDWPAPSNVRALCTTRGGGVSQGPFASLNLGDHVGDDPAHVAQNRERLHRTLGARPVFLRQVHGTAIHTLVPDTPDGTQADGATTTTPGLACTIMVADCLPVLLCDAAGTRVAAVHAGWRGLAGVRGRGVLEQAHQCFMPPALVDAAREAPELIAWLGPCIGPQAFEVGADVVAAFTDEHPAAQDCFTPQPNGKWLANLPGLARQRLRALGVTCVYGNDGSAPWCTVGDPLRFFSHRRDAGVSGRLAACVWLAA
jgi:YfiH family protein